MVAPLVPTFGRQKQVDLYTFKASLVYIASSSMGCTVRLCLKKKIKIKKEWKNWLEGEVAEKIIR